MRAFISWSGGKDCSFALYKFLKNPENKACYLVNFAQEKSSTSKFHRFEKDIFESQSASVGIPFIQEIVSPKGYEYHLKKIISKLRNEGINAAVFGDIFLEAHKTWLEKVCQESGISPVFPLWGKESLDIANDYIQSGFKSTITTVLDKSEFAPLLGKELNEETLDIIKMIEGADPCGENGEYHTLVTDGPIFNNKISVITGEFSKDAGHLFVAVSVQNK